MNLIPAILSTLCFLGGFFYSVAMLRSGRHRTSGINLTVMGTGFVLQGVFLYTLGRQNGHCPMANVFEILMFISWAVVLLYLLLGPPFRVSLLGVFTAPMVFVFQTVALLLPAEMKTATRPESGTMDRWLEMHAALSLLAYGAFALAFVAGIMYLLQDRYLKKHRLETLFYNLPPIRLLGKSISRLVAIGFLLLTIGIASAFLMEERPSLIHFAMTLAVWGIYGILFALQTLRGLGAKRLATYAVWAFLVPILTLWAVAH